MITTDPIADMLTRIRNGYHTGADSIDMPYSRMKGEIARILKREGFLTDYAVEGGGVKTMRLVLKYHGEREPTIRGMRRVSKPGLRQYVAATKIPRVLGGMGLAILTTPAGVMTDGEARRQKVGGEIICRIW